SGKPSSKKRAGCPSSTRTRKSQRLLTSHSARQSRSRHEMEIHHPRPDRLSTRLRAGAKKGVGGSQITAPDPLFRTDTEPTRHGLGNLAEARMAWRERSAKPQAAKAGASRSRIAPRQP